MKIGDSVWLTLTGWFKALIQLANFTIGPDATLNTEIHKTSIRIKAPNSVNASKGKHKNQINHYIKQRRVLLANSIICQSKWKPIVEPRRAKPRTYRQAPSHWLKFYEEAVIESEARTAVVQLQALSEKGDALKGYNLLSLEAKSSFWSRPLFRRRAQSPYIYRRALFRMGVKEFWHGCLFRIHLSRLWIFVENMKHLPDHRSSKLFRKNLYISINI